MRLIGSSSFGFAQKKKKKNDTRFSKYGIEPRMALISPNASIKLQNKTY